MKKLLTILGLLVTTQIAAQQISVIQINAKWNNSNNRDDFEQLRGCSYNFAWLEDQPESLKSEITSVPTLIIFKDGRVVKIYNGGLMLQIDVELEEVQRKINALKEE